MICIACPFAFFVCSSSYCSGRNSLFSFFAVSRVFIRRTKWIKNETAARVCLGRGGARTREARFPRAILLKSQCASRSKSSPRRRNSRKTSRTSRAAFNQRTWKINKKKSGKHLPRPVFANASEQRQVCRRGKQ